MFVYAPINIHEATLGAICSAAKSSEYLTYKIVVKFVFLRRTNSIMVALGCRKRKTGRSIKSHKSTSQSGDGNCVQVAGFFCPFKAYNLVAERSTNNLIVISAVRDQDWHDDDH